MRAIFLLLSMFFFKHKYDGDMKDSVCALRHVQQQILAATAQLTVKSSPIEAQHLFPVQRDLFNIHLSTFYKCLLTFLLTLNVKMWAKAPRH